MRECRHMIGSQRPDRAKHVHSLSIFTAPPEASGGRGLRSARLISCMPLFLATFMLTMAWCHTLGHPVTSQIGFQGIERHLLIEGQVLRTEYREHWLLRSRRNRPRCPGNEF